jgi:hypothetical protein
MYESDARPTNERLARAARVFPTLTDSTNEAIGPCELERINFELSYWGISDIPSAGVRIQNQHLASN